MKRREFLKASSLAALVSGAGVSNLLAAEGEVSAKGAEDWRTKATVGATPPVLQGVTEKEATVVWAVAVPSMGWVEYR